MLMQGPSLDGLAFLDGGLSHDGKIPSWMSVQHAEEGCFHNFYLQLKPFLLLATEAFCRQLKLFADKWEYH